MFESLPTRLKHALNAHAKFKLPCLKCGNSNLHFARFCGNCGNELYSGKLFLMLNSLSRIDTGKVYLSFMPMAERYFSKPKNALKFAVLALIIMISGLFIRELTAGQKASGKVSYEQFSEYLSQQFSLGSDDLKFIMDNPDNDASSEMNVDIFKAIRIEKRLRSKLHDENLTIFPNRFFGFPIWSSASSSGPEIRQITFSDVPYDHPIYSSAMPLLNLGVPLWDEHSRIRAYENISWDDWKLIIGYLASVFSLDKNAALQLAEHRSGLMNNLDLNNFLDKFSQDFGICFRKRFIGSGESYFPTRFEVFSVLADLFAEPELLWGNASG